MSPFGVFATYISRKKNIEIYGMYFAAVRISAFVASAMASRKNVLELLQTKE